MVSKFDTPNGNKLVIWSNITRAFSHSVAFA